MPLLCGDIEILIRLIRMLREAKGLTLEDLADRAGIHRTHLGLLERGERQPTLRVALNLALAVDLNLSELLLKVELIKEGKVSEFDALRSIVSREEKPECLRNGDALFRYTGMSGDMLLKAIHDSYNILDTIDAELVANGLSPLGGLVELANLSSMVGNILGEALVSSSKGRYIRNRPHQYPDLLSQHAGSEDLELKMALETNKPKGHLPKEGVYITFRYVLGSGYGDFRRGREHRGSTVWIWEVKVGRVSIDDFDLSNTEGDSGKTAVIKTSTFNNLPVVYFDPHFCPHPIKDGRYPAFN